MFDEISRRELLAKAAGLAGVAMAGASLSDEALAAELEPQLSGAKLTSPEATAAIRALAAENAQPGADWLSPALRADLEARIANGTLHRSPELAPPTAPPSIPTSGGRLVDGYADEVSINTGQTAKFRISSMSGSYVVSVLRLGWYGGAGATEVYRSATLPGIAYPGSYYTSPGWDANGMIALTWPVALSVSTAGWASGYYLASLIPVSTQVPESYIPFVVRDDSSTAGIVMQIPFATYQAYNHWGGKNMYHGDDGVPAKVVSYDRPYDESGGAGHLFRGDFQVLGWLEKNNYPVTYATSLDIHRTPTLMQGRKLLLSVFHDEYWSQTMRNNVVSWIGQGKSLAFLSSNNLYWRVRFGASAAGVANRTMACYKGFPEPSPEQTILFSDLGQSEAQITGVEYAGLNYPSGDADWIVTNANHWIYAGTGLTNGSHIAGVIGGEWDRVNAQTPSDTTILATVPMVDIDLGPTPQHTVVRDLANGAVVFNASTWKYGMYFGGQLSIREDLAIGKITRNLLSHVGVGPGDSVLPTVAITTPTPGQTLASSPVTIAGTATDNVSVSSVRLSLYRNVSGGQYWNGAAWQSTYATVAAVLATAGTTSTGWSYFFNAPPGGVFAVTAISTDPSGNYAVSPYQLFSIADATVPSVALTTPTSGQALTSKPVTIAGTASDNAGIGDVQIVLYRPADPAGQFWNGTTWQPTYAAVSAILANPGSTTTTYTYTFNPPQSGGYFYVAAIAVDTSYKYSVTPFTSFTLPDAAAPTATITTPNSGGTTGSITITGNATDNSAINQVGVLIYRASTGLFWNGATWQAAFTSIPANLTAPGAATTGFSLSFTPPGPGTYYLAAVPVDGSYNYSFTPYTIINHT
jgi:Bacterial Ig domain